MRIAGAQVSESWWGDTGVVLACRPWLGKFFSATEENFFPPGTFTSPPASTVLVTLFILFQLRTSNPHQNLMNHSNEFWLFGYG